LLAFGKTHRTSEDNFVAYIALHLPDVAGMRFEDVNGIELRLVSELLIQLIESGNLPPERRSSVTAEDEHNRFAVAE
jgi:hypothetical protein